MRLLHATSSQAGCLGSRFLNHESATDSKTGCLRDLNSGLWPYGLKLGFAEKQVFKLRFFFRTCLDCFQSTQNLYLDRIGNLKHGFSPKTWRKLSDPVGCPNQIPPGNGIYDLQGWRPTLWPLCYRTLASRELCLLILSLRSLQGAGVGPGLRLRKNNFSRPEKLIFRHCPCEPQTQCFRLWQIIFSHPPGPESWNGMNPKLGVCPKLGYTGIPWYTPKLQV